MKSRIVLPCVGVLLLASLCLIVKEVLSTPPAQAQEPPRAPKPLRAAPDLSKPSTPLPPPPPTAPPGIEEVPGQPVEASQSLQELVNRLKELDRDERTVRALIRKKLDDQRREQSRQAKELEELGIAPGAGRPPMPPSADGDVRSRPAEQKLDRVLERLEKLEGRIRGLEKASRTGPPTGSAN